MFDVLALEKKWSRYRLKKLLPFLATAAILSIAVGGASYLLVVKPDLIKDIIKNIPSIAPKAEQIVDTNKSIVKTAPMQISVEDEQNILEPSLTFIYNIEDQIINYNNTKVLASGSKAEEVEHKQQPSQISRVKSPRRSASKTSQQSREVAKTAKADHKVVDSRAKQPAQERTVNEAETAKKEILIHVRHDQITDSELNSVIRRFEEQKNPALSLFIAKKYYAQGSYEEAYNYALETNKLNPNIEDSVLIFSQSLVKLGKKEEAITTLKAYLDRSNSTEATSLLDKIEKGKFK